ncbi:MAG TPA: DUF2505 domain-containing protein [Mycobacteriales bacterium]|jgi:hypothetical protein|nr:DUF2505 domain-containing protein [Mycobacteriales bacterium]
MQMRVTHHFNGDVDQVFALVTDPKFLERKFAAGGAKDISVDLEQLADGTTRLTIRRHVTVDLPGFAKKFIQPTNALLQTENWEPAAEGEPRTCRYRVDVQGVPSHIDGVVTLTPDGTGTRQDIEAKVKVSIPIVGGKLEKLAVDSGEKLLADEAAFTNKELAG